MDPVTITKIQAADALLDRAVELLLDKRDFIAAIVLGGSADDILQGLLEKQGKTGTSAREQLIPHLRAWAAKFDLAGEPSLTDGQGHSLLRHVFDWLRHADKGDDSDPAEFDLEGEAVGVIERAIENRHTLGKLHRRAREVVMHERKLLSGRQ